MKIWKVGPKQSTNFCALNPKDKSMLFFLLLFVLSARANDAPDQLIALSEHLTVPEFIEERNRERAEFEQLIENVHPEGRTLCSQYWRTYEPGLIAQLFPQGNPLWDGPRAETFPKYYVACRRKGCGMEDAQWCCCAASCCCAACMLTYGGIKVAPYYLTCGALQALTSLCNIWGAKKGVTQTKQLDIAIGSAGLATRERIIHPLITNPAHTSTAIMPEAPSDDEEMQTALYNSIRGQDFLDES